MFAFLAVLAYTIALMTPAILDQGRAPMLGHETLTMLPFLPPQFYVPWIANPLAVAAVIALVYGKTMTSFLLALGAILCGCSIVFMLDPGMRLGAGFFVWQGSFAILAVGSLAEMFVTKRLPAE